MGAWKLKHFVIIYSFSVSSVASKLLEVKDYVLFTVKSPAFIVDIGT